MVVHLCAPLAPPLVTPKYGVARAQENKLPCIVPVLPSGIVVYYANVAEYYGATPEQLWAAPPWPGGQFCKQDL